MGMSSAIRKSMDESWVSVETFFALRLEVEMFMNEKGKVVAEL
jgi:hypothetical protein